MSGYDDNMGRSLGKYFWVWFNISIFQIVLLELKTHTQGVELSTGLRKCMVFWLLVVLRVSEYFKTAFTSFFTGSEGFVP